jgi:DNA invertase Pin-like site-specific DNA recombinase
MISRIHAGIARAKQQGKKLGRPSKLNASLVNAVNLLREKGVTVRDISKTCSVGVGTVYRILRGEFSPEKLAA